MVFFHYFNIISSEFNEYIPFPTKVVECSFKHLLPQWDLSHSNFNIIVNRYIGYRCTLLGLYIFQL
ncbi:hypothetical protein BK785_15375 [Bacillus thuringiensis serovar bolivia]|nr:hypothetical protein BK785_15375 [Bacillus thuringiensis serovar bolivia]OUA74632.1 hypothetical protein BK787_18670 [Bacillus thuringiensis serovar pahangi]